MLAVVHNAPANLGRAVVGRLRARGAAAVVVLVGAAAFLSVVAVPAQGSQVLPVTADWCRKYDNASPTPDDVVDNPFNETEPTGSVEAQLHRLRESYDVGCRHLIMLLDEIGTRDANTAGTITNIRNVLNNHGVLHQGVYDNMVLLRQDAANGLLLDTSNGPTVKINDNVPPLVKLDGTNNRVRLTATDGTDKGHAVTCENCSEGGGGGVPGTEENPQVVKLASSDTTASTLEQGFNATTSAVWFVAGLAVAALAVVQLLRQVMPR